MQHMQIQTSLEKEVGACFGLGVLLISESRIEWGCFLCKSCCLMFRFKADRPDCTFTYYINFDSATWLLSMACMQVPKEK